MNNKIIGTMLIVTSTISFGIMPLFSKLAYREGINVNTLLFLRFFIGAVVLWTYIFAKKMDFKTTQSHIRYLFLLSLLGYTITAVALFYSYTYISSSLATIIFFSHPIMVVAYEMITIKSSRSLKKIFSLFGTTIGLVIVVWTGSMKVSFFGIFLSFISASAYAFFCIGITEKRTQKMNSLLVSGYILAFCALLNFTQCIILKRPLIAPNLRSFIYASIIAVISTVVSTICLYNGIKKIGPGTATIISTFEPVFVYILGAIFLKEVLTLNVIIGGILIILSMIILQIPKSKCQKIMTGIKHLHLSNVKK